MKYLLLGLCAAALLFVPVRVKAEVVDRIVAIVNEDVITLGEVQKYVEVEKKSRYSSVNEYVRNTQLRERVDAFIENLLISQQGKKLKLEVDDKDVEQAIETLARQNSITKEQLKEQLKTEKIEYKDFEDGIKKSILRNRVLARVLSQAPTVTEKAVREYYDTHASEFDVEEYKLQQIFISVKRPDAVDRSREAFTLLRENRPFEEVARLYSDENIKLEDAGYVKKDEMIPALANAVKLLLPGTFSTPVQTEYGFHIIKLIEERKDPGSFEAAKGSIQEKLYKVETEKKYKDYITKLKSSAYIEVKI
jgi:peptidyl-prolyl cis-trans isomerase SurA